MSTPSGLESRYLSRFTKLNPQSGRSIKNYDSAGNVADHLTQAKASLKAQEANTKSLFNTAQELVAGIDTTQQMFGHNFVKNMPLPNQAIKESPSQQLGYVQLAMRFFQAGVVHFMEQMVDAQERISHLESLVEKLALYDEEISPLGDIQALDLDQLEVVTRTTLSDVTRPVSPKDKMTPPVTPTKHVAVEEEILKPDLKKLSQQAKDSKRKDRKWTVFPKGLN